MPDLQSELNKILTQSQFDDDGDKTSTVVVTTSPEEVVVPTDASHRERAWHYVKANPGATVGEIASAIGTTTTGIAGGLHKMMMRGDLTRTRPEDGSGYRYYAATDKYEVMSVEERIASMQRARALRGAKPGPKPKLKRQVKKTKAAPVKWVDDKHKAPAAFDADAILANLNVLQARELMDKLRKLFGV